MRFLILDTDYPEFLRWLYAHHPGLEQQPYEEQMRVRAESFFGVAHFYSSNLRKLGHEAYDIYANNELMQKAWAGEYGLGVGSNWRWKFRLRKGVIPWLSRARDQRWFYNILAAQIKHYKPDVLLNQAMDGINSQFLKEIRSLVRLVVGQHAAPLPQGQDFRVYDLIISSLPNFVDYFRQRGINSELHRMGFEPVVLERLNETEKTIPVSFVGSLSRFHSSRRRWLGIICQHARVTVWGGGIDRLPKESPILNLYQGTAWGLEMYQILRASMITLNHHIDAAESYANNLRLFEATGVGALLITDWKQNLHKIFEPDKEVVAYHTPEECVELIKHYLKHDDKREAIARAGQKRTLGDHTYYRRMQELLKIIQRFL